MAGKLYLVATPIGNLGDISARAAATLGGADFIAAEDTRVSVRLLNHLGIKKPLISYHEHNRAGSGEKILTRILDGESCALVTDAGTPAISDPGEDLVKLCAQHGIEIISIPGPCAAVAALSASGLPTGRFAFEGFLSVNGRSRREHLESLTNERRTMVFYEAPHKLNKTLKDLLDALGDRQIVIFRELTKLHEQTLRATLSGAVGYFDENAPIGEFVIVVEGATEDKEPKADVGEAVAMVESYVDEGLSFKDAVKKAAFKTGLSKNILYDAATDNARQR